MKVKEIFEALSIYDENMETNITDIVHFRCNCCGEMQVDLLEDGQLDDEDIS
jgi:hypothetical protein